MKTRKTIRKISHNSNQFFKIIWVAIVMGIGLGSVTQPVWAEESIPDVQNAQIDPAKKPTMARGIYPLFSRLI